MSCAIGCYSFEASSRASGESHHARNSARNLLNSAPMGAKLGLNVQINSKFCADLSLLEIGEGSVIGGHATVIGHSFERRGLLLKKVRIGRHAVIGLNAVLLPGVEVGDRAIVAAGAVVPKGTRVAADSVYLGAGAGADRAAHRHDGGVDVPGGDAP